ncbi:hypothetical protein [Acinetobacter sp. 'aerobic (ED)']|uniref:hypothetical protein n=1 Tax=Acinetobacter sp. 'aerobic (ED)' TaxID=174230 RepID=UPI00192A84DF|nr:hypothetical protein [Acinetobacter sp. 'aerobic (ED)']
MDKNYIGKICIRRGNKFQEPSACFITGINGFGMLVCRVINTGSLVMTEPDEEGELIDFDFKKLELLRAEWAVENAKKSVQVTEERYQELLEKNQ